MSKTIHVSQAQKLIIAGIKKGKTVNCIVEKRDHFRMEFTIVNISIDFKATLIEYNGKEFDTVCDAIIQHVRLMNDDDPYVDLIKKKAEERRFDEIRKICYIVGGKGKNIGFKEIFPEELGQQIPFSRYAEQHRERIAGPLTTKQRDEEEILTTQPAPINVPQPLQMAHHHVQLPQPPQVAPFDTEVLTRIALSIEGVNSSLKEIVPLFKEMSEMCRKRKEVHTQEQASVSVPEDPNSKKQKPAPEVPVETTKTQENNNTTSEVNIME